jgi:hypothetical protein
MNYKQKDQLIKTLAQSNEELSKQIDSLSNATWMALLLMFLIGAMATLLNFI